MGRFIERHTNRLNHEGHEEHEEKIEGFHNSSIPFMLFMVAKI